MPHGSFRPPHASPVRLLIPLSPPPALLLSSFMERRAEETELAPTPAACRPAPPLVWWGCVGRRGAVVWVNGPIFTGIWFYTPMSFTYYTSTMIGVRWWCREAHMQNEAWGRRARCLPPRSISRWAAPPRRAGRCVERARAQCAPVVRGTRNGAVRCVWQCSGKRRTIRGGVGAGCACREVMVHLPSIRICQKQRRENLGWQHR